MNQGSKISSRAIKTAILLSSVSFIHMAYAQEIKRTWAEADANVETSAADRVAYFKKNLAPHASIRYTNDEYHKTIVNLNWYDGDQSRSAVVNLKRTFDIYSLFEGTSLLLSPRAKAILDDLGEAIISEGINTRMYAIAGHSVSGGDKKGDQQLSVLRATAVKEYLKKKFDISDRRLVPVGFGSFNLKDKENFEAKKNNRIELCLIEDLYQRTPVTKIQLPDVSSDKSEGILISTAGEKSGKDKKPAKQQIAARTRKAPAKRIARKMVEDKMLDKKMVDTSDKVTLRESHMPEYKISESSYKKSGGNKNFETAGRFDSGARPLAPRRGSQVQRVNDQYAYADRTYPYADSARAYEGGSSRAYDDHPHAGYDNGAYDANVYNNRVYEADDYGYESPYGEYVRGNNIRCE